MLTDAKPACQAFCDADTLIIGLVKPTHAKNVRMNTINTAGAGTHLSTFGLIQTLQHVLYSPGGGGGGGASQAAAGALGAETGACGAGAIPGAGGGGGGGGIGSD
jgi:hypothetical protein